MNAIYRRTFQALGSFSKQNWEVLHQHHLESSLLLALRVCSRSAGLESSTPEVPGSQPHKVIFVKRVSSLRGTTKMEKGIMKDYGLDDKKYAYTVVKNTPKNCAQLWKVKHLVLIKPITFPYGMPTEADIEHTQMRYDGKMLVKKELKLADTPVDDDVDRRKFSMTVWYKTMQKWAWRT